MSVKDLVLFIVIFGSLAVAVWLPELGTIFQPYLLYLMMALLFLSFLRINFLSLLDASGKALVRLAMLAAVKLVVLPVALYELTLAILPEYAVPVLLLSGISTGVVAPFIATVLSADLTPVLRMVIVTSVLVPFTLPVLVKVLAGATVSIPLALMIRLLVLVIFVPMVAVQVMRRYFPGLIMGILDRQFPISLVFFAVINLGVFSKYSTFFFQNPTELAVAVGLAYLLAVIYYFTGFVSIRGFRPAERLSAGISLAVVNNVLVIVFSSQFFGPLSPTLAAMYMFPFFTMIVPIKLMINHSAWLSPVKEEEP
jgi:bile acid:Na+ symporter, BASS family